MRWKVAWVLSLAVLVLTGGIGVYNGLSEWGEGRTVLQHAVTVGVLLYGIFGLATAFGLFQRRRWSLGTAIAWAIPIIYVPGLAVMVYGEGATLGSAIAASATSALIALGVVWTVNATTRVGSPTRSTSENGARQ